MSEACQAGFVSVCGSTEKIQKCQCCTLYLCERHQHRKTLSYYLLIATQKGKHCKMCGGRLAPEISFYDHEDGWEVVGFQKKQWLSIQCLSCGYDWSLWKLGVER